METHFTPWARIARILLSVGAAQAAKAVAARGAGRPLSLACGAGKSPPAPVIRLADRRAPTPAPTPRTTP